MAMALLDTQEFGIGIYRGSERVGRIRFHIGIRAAEGEVSYSAADPELRRSLRTLMGRKRSWRWQDLTRRLIDSLSLSTGGASFCGSAPRLQTKDVATESRPAPSDQPRRQRMISHKK
jgi:hypothetical protein